MYDVIPFDFSNTKEPGVHFLINILNLIVFMPFGILLPLKSDKVKIVKHSLFCFIFSLILEVTQLFTKIGGYASDDLLMNTFGYIAGLPILYYVVNKMSFKTKNRALIICNIIFGIIALYAIIDIASIFGKYIDIIKDFA